MQLFFKRYRGFVPGILMILVSFIGLVYGIVPAGRNVWQMWEARGKLVSEIQALRAKTAILAGLDEETLRSELAALVSALPEAKAIPSVLATVDGLAASSGVSISTLTLANPGPLSTASAQKQSTEERKLGSSLINLSVTVDGTPQSIRNFLASAVAVRRLLRVRFFDMTYLSQATAEVHAGLDAFYAPLPISLGDITSPLTPLSGAEENTLAKISAYPLYGQIGTAALVPSAPSSGRDPFAP